MLHFTVVTLHHERRPSRLASATMSSDEANKHEHAELALYAACIAVLVSIFSALYRRHTNRPAHQAASAPIAQAQALPPLGGSAWPASSSPLIRQRVGGMGGGSVQRGRRVGYAVPEDDVSAGWDPVLLQSYEQHDEGIISSTDALQTSPVFQRWTRGKRMGYETTVEHKLRVYSALRKADPDGFERLFSRQDMQEYDCGPPSRLLAGADYLLASLTTLTLLGAPLLLPSLTPFRWPLLALWTVLQLAAVQLGCTSVSARAMSMYATRGGQHQLPAGSWQLLVVGILEALYLLGTAGAGLLPSLGSRLLSAQRQSVIERLVGVVLVVETCQPLHIPRLG